MREKIPSYELTANDYSFHHSPSWYIVNRQGSKEHFGLIDLSCLSGVDTLLLGRRIWTAEILQQLGEQRS